MNKLTKVDTDGCTYYCFIQLKDVLFPTVPKSTIKSWMRELDIKTVPCPQEHRGTFVRDLPSLSGAFGLLSNDKVQMLVEYSSHKRRSAILPHNQTTSSPATHFVPAPSTATNRQSTVKSSDARTSQGEYNIVNNCTDKVVRVIENEFPGKTTPTSTSGEASREWAAPQETHVAGKTNDGLADTTQAPSIVIIDESSCEQIAQVDEESGAEVPSPAKTCDNRCARAYSLSKDLITPDLQQELENLKRFYTSPINSCRRGQRLCESTFSKIRERILCYLGYVKISKPTKVLSLSLALDKELLDGYVAYMSEKRGLMASTMARHASAIIDAIKYVERSKAQGEIEKLNAVTALRNVRRQLSAEESVTRRRKREGFSPSEKDRSFLFAHILTTLRQLKEQYHNSSGIKSSRHLHDFTMLSLYIRASPGRAKELRTMQIIDNTLSDEGFSPGDAEGMNAILFERDGSVQLIETDFKTVKNMGPSKIDLSDDAHLIYFIKLYASEHRPRLLLGQSHDYLFLNARGHPFLSTSAVSKYIGDIFEREVQVRASVNKMRHAIVTYFMSIPDSENLKLRESLACLLKHSVRHQQQTYNDLRRQDRVEIGRKFMRKSILSYDHDDEERNEMASVESSSRQLSSGDTDETELLPLVGEFCALLDPASTGEKNALIFVAKVLRYTPDKKRVCLQEMEPVNDSSQLYRAKVSSVWWENVECISYPIDIVFSSSENAYQLRTTPAQIYHDIHDS